MASEHTQTMNPGRMWFYPGSDAWMNWDDRVESGQEDYEDGGMFVGMQIIWDLQNNYTEDAINDFFEMADWAKEQVQQQPEKAEQYLGPMLAQYAFIGEKYLQGMEEFESYRPKYESLWNQIGNQTKAINDEFNTIRAQYNDQYKQATAQGPLTLNFGGSQMVVPNYRATRELLAPQADILGQQSDLMSNKNNQLMSVLGGMNALTSNKLTAAQMFENNLAPQTNINSALYDTWANQYPQLMAIEQAKQGLSLLPLNFTQDVAMASMGMQPGQQSQTDWTGLIGNLIQPFAQAGASQFMNTPLPGGMDLFTNGMNVTS